MGADALLLLTACIWGFGFVAQRQGMEYIGPFAFNGIRFILGSISLFPLILLRSESRKTVISRAIPGAVLAGTCCFLAVSLQQMGIMFTTAGNAGFITGLYVVLTPIIGIFLGKKTGKATWTGVLFTIAGLYFISAAGNLNELNPGDILIAAGAVFWALHVLLIDFLVKKTDPLVLSSGQFMICGIFSTVAAFLAEPFMALKLDNLNVSGLFEWIPFPSLLQGLFEGIISAELIYSMTIPVLFGGLASVGIAYTLQVVAQKDAPPAHATIILCLEGFFAALGGIIILHEPFGTRTILGFILMFSGMLASQWEVIYSRRANGSKP